jgi:transposase
VKVLEHFANRILFVIGIEACGHAHYWARQLTRLGHEGQADAGEVRERRSTSATRTMQQTHGRSGLRCSSQASRWRRGTDLHQAMLALHQMREQLVKFRTMPVNSLRELLTEYGEATSKGRVARTDRYLPRRDESQRACRRR